MKNYHLLAAVALIAMAGCSENEITDVSPDVNPAVGFDIYTGAQTKGTVTDNEDGATGIKKSDKGFGVLAYNTKQETWVTSGFTPDFMWNQQVIWSSDHWTYTPIKYWPNTTGDKVSFFAYAPYGNGTTDNGILLSNKTAAKPTITFTLKDAANEMVDLVADKQLNLEKKTTAVGFNLKHLLSRVSFSAKLSANITAPTGGTGDGKTFVFVTGLRILGTEADNSPSEGSRVGENNKSLFYNKATFEWGADDNDGKWLKENAVEQSTSYVLSDKVLKLTGQTSTINANYPTMGVLVNQDGTSTSLFKDDQYLFLIPPYDGDDEADRGIKDGVNDVRILVSYDIVTIDDNLDVGFSKTTTYATVPLPVGSLKRGVAYNYDLKISMDKVEVEAAVKDWGTPTEISIPSVTAASGTSEDIQAAIVELNTGIGNGAYKNCRYFVVNVPGVVNGSTYALTAANKNFKSGDKIELRFADGGSPHTTGATLSGWTSTNSVSNIILTKE